MGHANAFADNRGDAEQLFRDAQGLLKSGRVAEACKTFEASQRLDPDLVTLMNVADCREKNGQLATAWATYLEVASKGRGDARHSAMANVADQRAKTIEPRLSRLVIAVDDARAIEGLAVTRNGNPVDASLWNRPIPIDGGHYAITATAAAHKAWSVEIDIANNGERRAVDVPALEQVQTIEQPAPQQPIAASASTVSPAETSGFGTRRKIALGVGVGALASFGGAIAFEIAGRNAYADYKETPEGAAREDLYAEANHKYALAQGFLIGGIVAAGAAGYLWWTGGTDRSATVSAAPLVTSDARGVALVGQF